MAPNMNTEFTILFTNLKFLKIIIFRNIFSPGNFFWTFINVQFSKGGNKVFPKK